MAGNEWRDAAPSAGTSPVRIDTSVAHIARVQDYWLGGRDNFAADRHAGEEAVAAFPGLVASVRSTRAFLARTVRYLTADQGIRQFLDIGTGIPTAGNTHSVAQAIAPEALVVYMDNDPVVFAHARGLLSSGPHGSTAYLDTDLRDTGKVLAETARMLDLTEPVALVLNSVLQFIPDAEDPFKIVITLLDALAPGSFLVVSIPPTTSRRGSWRAWRPGSTSCWRSRSRCAARRKWSISSRGCAWCRPGSSGCRSGGPTPPRTPAGWAPCGAASARSDVPARAPGPCPRPAPRLCPRPAPRLCTRLWMTGG